MKPLTILPSIDLRAGKVVRLKQGDYARQLNYDVDPLETARKFAAAGALWTHLVDLDGAKEGRPVQTDLIRKIIQDTCLKVEVGGGIRSEEDVQILLDCGASRVVIGTKAIEDWDWFTHLINQPKFAGKVVLALDAKNGMVATRGWTHDSGKSAAEIARRISDWPVAAILYTDVSCDGMMGGPNLEQTVKLAQAGKVPVIASGGVGSLDHVTQFIQTEVWGCIIGRALYEGTLNLPQAIQAAK